MQAALADDRLIVQYCGFLVLAVICQLQVTIAVLPLDITAILRVLALQRTTGRGRQASAVCSCPVCVSEGAVLERFIQQQRTAFRRITVRHRSRGLLISRLHCRFISAILRFNTSIGIRCIRILSGTIRRGLIRSGLLAGCFGIGSLLILRFACGLRRLFRLLRLLLRRIILRNSGAGSGISKTTEHGHSNKRRDDSLSKPPFAHCLPFVACTFHIVPLRSALRR